MKGKLIGNVTSDNGLKVLYYIKNMKQRKQGFAGWTSYAFFWYATTCNDDVVNTMTVSLTHYNIKAASNGHVEGWKQVFLKRL